MSQNDITPPEEIDLEDLDPKLVEEALRWFAKHKDNPVVLAMIEKLAGQYEGVHRDH